MRTHATLSTRQPHLKTVRVRSLQWPELWLMQAALLLTLIMSTLTAPELRCERKRCTEEAVFRKYAGRVIYKVFHRTYHERIRFGGGGNLHFSHAGGLCSCQSQLEEQRS